ncbi:ABC transporter substrate-binding protein [Psychrobacter sp. LV10R520-6]|uniref:ABC transporter substrate-binding protein n=1 Tax=Psychrobacter sp. LV10R520-6 TaxID=1415574 RepID=UPI0024C740F2|nr:ABC transporter substrate-binding protein [Psychrobacter sp. LV10R520-6]SNT70138.1 putative ABC transport system substrate-binding protein [Psychrobacter sp. LV10R520-6]
MTIATTLRLSLCGAAISAISTLGLMGCSNSSTEPAATTDNSTANAEKPAKTLAITQIVEHPSLDDMRRGIIDELADNGYVEGENLKVNFQSAQGNMATAGQIAKQFAGDNPDAIVAISTPSAQSVVAATTTIPIVYTAVSDPLGAKLITADGKPFQDNLTGLSSQLPLEPQLDLLQKIKPSIKTIGYVYSPGEANSVSLRDNLKEALPARGLSLLDIPANRPTDIGMATRSLQGRADIIYTSFDNNVASAFEAMTQAANEIQMPIVASDEFSVQRGATAALGVNDYDFGRVTGKMVYRILDGEAVNTIKPEVMNDLTLYVSPKHAKAQGVSLSADMLKNGINVDTKGQNANK